MHFYSQSVTRRMPDLRAIAVESDIISRDSIEVARAHSCLNFVNRALLGCAYNLVNLLQFIRDFAKRHCPSHIGIKSFKYAAEVERDKLAFADFFVAGSPMRKRRPLATCDDNTK